MARGQAFLLSCAAVAIATMCRLAFLQPLGDNVAFVTFYPAVTIAALLGGFWPGVVATFLSTLSAHYFVMDPGSFSFNPPEVTSLAIFMVSGILVSYMSMLVEQARKKQHAAETAAGLAQAAVELKESEERFSTLSEITLEGVVISEGGRIVDANGSFCQKLGYEKSELIGVEIKRLLLKREDQEEVYNQIIRGIEIMGEFDLVRKDGAIISVEAHGRNTAYRNGTLRITSIRDITGRKKLEQSLREDREKLALFVKHAPAALAMFDRDMRYVYVSQRWISDYGLVNRELIGVSHYEVFPDLPENWKAVHHHALSGEIISAEADPYVKRDGSVVWNNWEVRPWYEANGSVGGIIIFIEDVTQRKKDEEQLKELSQRLTYHMNNSPLAVVEWGPDMRFMRWSGAAERIFGWKSEEVLGKQIEDIHLVYEEDQPQVMNVIHELAEGVNTTRFSVNRNYRKDGSVAFCEWYNSSLLDDSGKLRSILSFALDVTERKELEHSLLQYSELLESRVSERTAELIEKNKMLLHQSRLAAMGEMLNTIAHQWRQPLNVLGLHIQSLTLDGEPQEDLNSFITKCMKLIQHMSDTINHFRDFFRPEEQKVDFSINTYIAQAVDLIESGYKQNNIEIILSPVGCAVVNGYPHQFAQAVLGILQNARDAILERKITDGKIAIHSSIEEGRAVITIADNAGGIPEEIISRVFEPYFSTKGTLGTGIGLFMAKTIVENMRGSISIGNTETGAEFKIVLPSMHSKQVH